MLHVFYKTAIAGELEKGDICKGKNGSFRVYDQGIVTYEQNRLGLSAYCHKRYVLVSGIHTSLQGFC